MHINIDTQNKEIRVIEPISESIELKGLLWELENTVMNLEEYSIFIDKQKGIPHWGTDLPDKIWKGDDPLSPPWIITGDSTTGTKIMQPPPNWSIIAPPWRITGPNGTGMITTPNTLTTPESNREGNGE